MTIAEAAEVVMKGAREPMHPREVAAKIVASNLFQFKTEDTNGVEARALRKSDKFEKIGNGRYMLRD